MTDDANLYNPLTTKVEARTVAPGVHVLPGFGNAIAIETSTGVVQIDTGLSPSMAENMLAELRARTDLPVTSIVYSHGHGGYNEQVQVWLDHNESRGEPAPRIVAQENLLRRQQRYRDTNDLQNLIAEIQFRMPAGSARGNRYALHRPTETFRDEIDLGDGDGNGAGERSVLVLATPSETDDAVSVWLPDCRLLWGGPAVVPCFPNVGSPMRSLRDPVRWVATLERLRELRPEILVFEFGPVLEGADHIDAWFGSVIAALTWVREEVVERLNAGMLVDDIVHDLDFPPELFDTALLAPTYGHPEHVAREVVRAETGWWDRNPTHLRPARTAEAAEAVASAIADPGRVVERARELLDADQPQLALHVVDLLAMAPGDSDDVTQARSIKAEACRTLAQRTPNFIEQSVYLSAATIIDDQPAAPTGVR